MSDDEFERKNRRNKDVTWDEYQYIRANCRNVPYVGAEMVHNADLEQNGVEMPSTQILGVTDNMDDIEDKTIDQGRFFIGRRGRRVRPRSASSVRTYRINSFPSGSADRPDR